MGQNPCIIGMRLRVLISSRSWSVSRSAGTGSLSPQNNAMTGITLTMMGAILVACLKEIQHVSSVPFRTRSVETKPAETEWSSTQSNVMTETPMLGMDVTQLA